MAVQYSGVTPRHLAPVVHILGILGIALMTLWTYSFRGGYGLSGAAVFNLHPLLMFAGFIVLSSEAIIAFKTLNGEKPYQKAVHMTVQGAAIVVAIVGVSCAYKFHMDSNIQNFYSLHSWFGVITLLLYVMQWSVGFVAFWRQSAAKARRAELLPWHVFAGLVAYAAALATAELGLLEKLTFLQKSASPLGLWSSEAMLVNCIGIAIFAYGALVVLTTLVPNSRKEAPGFRDLLD